uniref:Cadherin-related family member 1 n=1 Tax=Tetraodon nigroviridis TaxID=99883 RepID=H3CBH9_TETNG
MKKEQSPQALLFLLLIHATLDQGQSDYAPYFYDNGASSKNGNMALFSISEDTAVGTQVYVLNGTDPEGDPVRYGLTFEKGSKEYFRVDSKSGNVSLIQELDREKQDEISVLVSITDGRNKVVETVRVFVTDANDEAPEFQNPPFIVAVSEDTAAGSSIYRVQAVDRDMGSGGSVSYFLQVVVIRCQTSPFSKFTIDGHSGILRIKPGETLDYETTPTHFVTVVAKDGGGKYKGRNQVLSSTATITVNVIDAQDMPPSFIGTPYFGYIYEVSVPGSEIITVSARDGDQGNPNPIFYSILNGKGSGTMSVVHPFDVLMVFHLPGSDGVFEYVHSCFTRTCQITKLHKFLFSICYGVPVIKLHCSFLSSQLLAVEIDTPERFSATADIVINLLDTNDNVPKFTSEYYIARIPENSAGGSSVATVTANDPDSGPWGEVKYTIYGSGSDL